MIRIVILADIHGNLPAFEAALADIRQLAPDRVIVNGDVINRGPQSKECLQAVRATGWPVVFGNHEWYAIKRVDGEIDAQWRTDFWLPFERVAQALTDEEVAYIRALPHEIVIDLPGLPAIRIVHGSMRALNDGIGFWMPDEELLEAADGAPEPIIIGAHTHRTYERRVGDRWFLNCGAVGAPFNGDPGAQYLVMTTANGTWRAEFRSVPYDREPVYMAWRQTDILQRSMAAQIFKLEVETATYHLGSYVHFCQIHGLDRNAMSSFERYRLEAGNLRPGRSLKDG
jgi:predicted phosphodiesterase